MCNIEPTPTFVIVKVSLPHFFLIQMHQNNVGLNRQWFERSEIASARQAIQWTPLHRADGVLAV